MNEIMKTYEQLEKFEPATLDRNMLQLTSPQRTEALIVIGKKVAEMNPTMANEETYLALRTDEEKTEDFSWNTAPEVVDSKNNIVRAGGVSADYRERVRMIADYNDWKAFWFNYNHYEEDNKLFPNDIPTFNWHIDHIKRYIFSVLTMEDAMKYISALTLKITQAESDIVNSKDDEVAKYQKKHYRSLSTTIMDMATNIVKSYEVVKKLEE